jgi:hypothetical protein
MKTAIVIETVVQSVKNVEMREVIVTMDQRCYVIK